MGLIGLLVGKKRVQFIQNNTTVLQLDCSIKENHSRKSPATENPIENGDTISDHIIMKPFDLEITGEITDTPIGGVKDLIGEAATTLAGKLLPPKGLIAASAGVALFSALQKKQNPSVAAYNQLLKLQEKGQALTILTSLKRYTNMWISDVSAPREAAQANALLFTVHLVQLIIVKPQSVNISIFANPSLAAGEADTGQEGLGAASKFKQGVADATKLVGGK